MDGNDEIYIESSYKRKYTNKVIFNWYKDLMKVEMQDLCGPFTWVAIHMPFSFQFWNPKNLIFLFVSFFPMDTNQMSIVYNGFVHVKHGFHHLKCDNLALRFFRCVFKFEHSMHAAY